MPTYPYPTSINFMSEDNDGVITKFGNGLYRQIKSCHCFVTGGAFGL